MTTEFEKESFVDLKSSLLKIFSGLEEMYVGKEETVVYEKSCIRTGFKDLDKLIQGLYPGDLITIASRPGMGKTSLALNLAINMSGHEKKRGLFISLEMLKTQIVMKLLCSESVVDSQSVSTGQLSEKEWTRIIRAADRLSEQSLFLLDKPVFGIDEIIGEIRKLHETCSLEFAVIDYLQLINGRSIYQGNRTQELSDISRSLKQLAMELEIPIIVLSELNRSVESRNVKIPLLADLRDSGSIEDDSDMVMFLYREDYYYPDTENRNIATLILAKARNHPQEQMRLFFHQQFGKFASLVKINDK